MEIIDWIQFVLGTAFLCIGVLAFVIQVFGVFKFKYVLNRMHSAAIGDTLGIGASMIGLMILSGFTFTTLKLALVVAFLWCASPVSSHLISKLEVTTNPELEQRCGLEERTKEELRKEIETIDKREQEGER